MYTIKFSHHYQKMPMDFSSTFLAGLYVEDISLLSEIFIKYDTEYGKEERHYELPKTGKVIVLLLLSEANIFQSAFWTTIRRWTPRKEEFYRSLVGQEVGIEIKEDL